MDPNSGAKVRRTKPSTRGDIFSPNCRFCGRTGLHRDRFCPYLSWVPPGAQVGPGYKVACRCHNILGGHPDHSDWIGHLVPPFDKRLLITPPFLRNAVKRSRAKTSDPRNCGYKPPISKSQEKDAALNSQFDSLSLGEGSTSVEKMEGPDEDKETSGIN